MRARADGNSVQPASTTCALSNGHQHGIFATVACRRLPLDSARKLRWFDKGDVNSLVKMHVKEKRELMDTIAALKLLLVRYAARCFHASCFFWHLNCCFSMIFGTAMSWNVRYLGWHLLSGGQRSVCG